MKPQRLNLKTDLYLLGFLALFAVTALFMGLTATHILLNTIYLGIALLLVALTYFLGLMFGLVANMVFIFGQGTIMVYQNVLADQTVSLVMIFWLLMPLALSVVFHGVAQTTLQLQTEITHLAESQDQYSAFDEATHLRTTVAYYEDAGVFLETSRRFSIPVSTIAIRLRYLGELRQLLSRAQFAALIRTASRTLDHATRDNDVVYYVNQTTPTWAVLLYTDKAGAQIAANRIRTSFAAQLAQQPDMPDVDVSLIIGIASSAPAAVKTPAELMHAALKETEYDV
ncbi:GGDEF domain-containing protein [Schleiferilactobacillus harbinensis]|jgi:GGDEF domain-containing protein|uniref:GGDEF domain protein n=1 Tax=Schleiferilactobacillus harbinensis DSM 16991 TaxID=1122147 RepID=A0A0R1X8A5_9LACO|nr:GGDEF domain-containing protein [Schleiferilactobacillus harbinensis]HAY54060.1 GGDEF domain-containing protein [Lactobacillus sp.]KRM26021.1 GGDEF domain protein [Schleiferilactobacillus harbinensis DSM 16991]MCI1686704.1 GGDEF domain-containing protein [Schleiferilactobacillus harbinensis]MCI1784429.1 GGDEF domain-containing protein [Schleiferilactobacillus harbinensis]MCI1849334.1 GGDEF domain-containing protein [Schleiferilactobacillus harbinensis]